MERYKAESIYLTIVILVWKMRCLHGRSPYGRIVAFTFQSLCTFTCRRPDRLLRPRRLAGLFATCDIAACFQTFEAARDQGIVV